jgi:hypothetical protein
VYASINNAQFQSIGPQPNGIQRVCRHENCNLCGMRLFPFLGDKGSSITSIFISSCLYKFKLSNAYIIRYIEGRG